jgi:hypothetical protein
MTLHGSKKKLVKKKANNKLDCKQRTLMQKVWTPWRALTKLLKNRYDAFYYYFKDLRGNIFCEGNHQKFSPILLFNKKIININKNITDNVAEIYRDPWAVAIFIRPTSKKWAWKNISMA